MSGVSQISTYNQAVHALRSDTDHAIPEANERIQVRLLLWTSVPLYSVTKVFGYDHTLALTLVFFLPVCFLALRAAVSCHFASTTYL